MNTDLSQRLIEMAKSSGADAAAAIIQADIRYDRGFRQICEKNGCGNYGMCHMCPPAIGEIDMLMKRAQTFPYAVLYQTVHPIEDSFDIAGMQAAAREHGQSGRTVQRGLRQVVSTPWLHLGTGNCGLCDRCAKRDDLPCRYPNEALPSLEAYGIFVSETAENAGLNYINGTNTVTYFGMILFGEHSVPESLICLESGKK